MKKILVRTLLFFVLVAAAVVGWRLGVRPTRIALVNYPEYQVARFTQSVESRFHSLRHIQFEQGQEHDLSKYDFVLVWAHGVPFTEEIRNSLRKATGKGRGVFCVGATSAENDFTNLEGEELAAVEGYMRNGGVDNFGRLFTYVRHRIHAPWFFAPEAQPVIEIAADVFFHLDERYFESFSEYQAFRASAGLHKEGSSRVAVLTSNLGPRNSGRDDLDSIIVALEKQGLNVFPMDGFGRRFEFLDSVAPQAVIAIPHGRFAPGRDAQTAAWLRERNIPLISPIKVFRDHQQWLDDQRGMDGGVMGQSIVMPELDGAIEPYVLSALFPDEHGGKDFRAIPGRAQRIAQRVANWITLQKKPNAEKRVTIVYLKGPGQNALIAQGLEVLPSLYTVLRNLRDSGYSVQDLPPTLEEFGKLVHAQGMVPGPYAKGTVENLLKNGYPEIIPVATYEKWARESLGDSLWKLVLNTYGQAPGSYLSIPEGEKAGVLVNRIVFGNVQIMPQPLPGYGDNEFELVHGVQVPPPHPYIAAYLWAAHGFQSDALIHFGTHGSFEFLPSKQVALSDYDWPLALIGNMPHGYVYTINNIGEAMMAKRRSKAVMLSHLTPAFMNSDLYGDLQQLHDKIHHYLLPDLDPTNRAVYAESIKELVLRTNLHKDLELDSLADRDMREEDLDRVHNYVHSLEAEKVGQGLYVMGRPYTREDAHRTAVLMHVDAVAYSLMELDVRRGLQSSAISEKKHEFEMHYKEPAFAHVEAALAGENVLSKLLTEKERSWLSSASGRRPSMGTLGAKPTTAMQISSREDLGALVAQVVVDTSIVRFVKSWESRREYMRLASLLDPGARRRFDQAAGVIPEMHRIAAFLDRPGMDALLRVAGDTADYRRIREIMEDPQTQNRLAHARQERLEKLRTLFASQDYQSLWKNMGDSAWVSSLPQCMGSLDSLMAILQLAQGHRDLLPVEAVALAPVLIQRLQALQKIQARAADLEDEHRRAARNLAEALRGVTRSRDGLLSSPQRELSSIQNLLRGGHVEPSPGGDPVTNPEAVPTGRNLFAINAENTPTRESYKIALRMMDNMLKSEIQKNGAYPRKVGLTLWGGEFVRDQGVTLAQALVLMGVAPVWNSRGRMYDLKLIPSRELGRSRIDVVVQTSGQFRDMAASRLYLLNRAVRLATEADQDEHLNFVRQGSLETEAELVQSGEIAPARAARISRVRTFGGVNGNYGTGIMGLVESGDKWEEEKQIQDRYMLNMGAIYDEEEWGAFDPGAFRAALRNTEVVLQSRSSNTTGPISLDHTYEFMGGLLSAVRAVNGKDARALFTDTRNRFNPVVQEAKEAIWQEARTTILNPKYVQHMVEEGESAAEYFAESVRNTYGWEVMRPDLVDDELWHAYYEMFVQDKLQTGIRDFMEEKNPYAFQEITAVMLETIRKGYWDPGAEIVEQLATEHAQWVAKHGAGCSGFVCDNAKLREFIGQKMEPETRQKYSDQLRQVLQTSTAREAVKMEKEEISMVSRILPGAVSTWWMGLLLLVLVGVLVYFVHTRSRR